MIAASRARHRSLYSTQLQSLAPGTAPRQVAVRKTFEVRHGRHRNSVEARMTCHECVSVSQNLAGMLKHYSRRPSTFDRIFCRGMDAAGMRRFGQWCRCIVPILMCAGVVSWLHIRAVRGLP